MGNKPAAVQLAKAGLYLLPEPRVLIEVMLDELTNVFPRATVLFRGDVSQLGLKFVSKVKFHEATPGAKRVGVKRSSSVTVLGPQFKIPTLAKTARMGHPAEAARIGQRGLPPSLIHGLGI